MEETYQATEFDQQTTSHRLQIMKAAIPYMPVRQQKALSMFIKIQELQNTMQLFQDDDNVLGICSLSEEERNPLDMLESIKAYCTEKEAETLEVISNFFQASQLFRQYQNLSRQDPDGSADPMDVLFHLLSPEQQNTFAQYQSLLHQPQ